MGSVFKKTVTRPLPPGAEIIIRQGVRLARWRDGKGKMRTAPVTTGQDGADRIRDESSTYFARYRDGNGVVVETPTGCRDETAARQVLADLERQAERVRAGLLTPAEARIAEHLATPIGEHVDAYIDQPRSRAGRSPKHVAKRRRILNRLAGDCGFAPARRPGASSRRALAQPTTAAKGRSARSRNTHRTALIAFGNWCVDRIGRLIVEPVPGDARRPNEKADPRRRRRAMTEAELVRLLDVARRRPLLDALTVRRGKRKGEAYRQRPPRSAGTARSARPGAGPDLQDAGAHRAQKERTGEPDRRSTPARRRRSLTSNSTPPTRRTGRATASSSGPTWRTTCGTGSPTSSPPSRRTPGDGASRSRPDFPADTPVFDVPAGLVRIFDRDLKRAGIPKRDDRGRTLDVHALRTTFGTLLSRGGVPLRTAQAAMRHSDPSLTANVYTDPEAARRAAGPSTPCRAFRSTPDRTRAQSEPERPGPGLTAVPPLHCPLH